MGALKPLLKLERSTCREYLLFEDGVGIALLLAEVGGLGEPVEGVYWVSANPPNESWAHMC